MTVEKIEIESLAYQGAGVGHTACGKTVFVSAAVPGDIVTINVKKQTDSYDICEIDQLWESSPHRIAPLCQYSEICGGCPWQNIQYSEQLSWKRNFVIDALERIGKFADIQNIVDPCQTSNNAWSYRNKIEFSVVAGTEKLQLGLHGPSDSNAVMIDKCLLMPKQLQNASHKLSGALSYALKDGSKDLLRIGLRNSTETKDLEVAIWMLPSAINRNMVAKVIDEALRTTSIVRVISSSDTKKREVKKVEVLAGKGYWRENLNGKVMKISAPSFFQANTAVAKLLVNKVMSLLEQTKVDELSHVLDLYCGAGTFTLPLAERYFNVSAVESVGSSIRDLRRNLEDNQLGAEVIGGDVARELSRLPKAQAAVVDPPRSGLSDRARLALVEASVPVIVYVSCNPTTLARDLRFFADNGYQLSSISPFDLFPQTYHVETIALISLVP